jgi:hypothetical protein
MKKTKLFSFVLVTFIIFLAGALFWFETQDDDENIVLPDSVIQELQEKDSLEKAHFLNQPPLKVQETLQNELVFEQTKDAYNFKIIRDSLGLKLVVFYGTDLVGIGRDKAFENMIKAETTDLNSDDYPEILIYSKEKNKLIFTGFEAQNGLHKFSLPALMGRQAFGYAGQDSIYISENGNLIRQFRYKNDSFADIQTGTRTCEYALGFDLKFSMIKSLNNE